jgi:HEAT repeat protein
MKIRTFSCRHLFAYLVPGILLVAIFAGLCWLIPGRAPEPAYGGKPLSYWLTNAVDRTLNLDSNAVSFLIKALKRDSWTGAAVYRKQVWPKSPPAIQKVLPPPPPDHPLIRRMAVTFLLQLGPLAKPAVPSLIRALRDDDDWQVRRDAAILLGQIGEGNGAAVAALAGAFDDANLRRGGNLKTIRFFYQVTAKSLCQLDPEAATKELMAALNSKDSNLLTEMVRESAAWGLGQIGQGNEPILTALTNALRDRNWRVRDQATNALQRLDPAAAAKARVFLRIDPEEAVKQIKALRGDMNIDVRQRAAEVLGASAKGNFVVVGALNEALSDRALLVRKAATNALWHLAPAAAAKAGAERPAS